MSDFVLRSIAKRVGAGHTACAARMPVMSDRPSTGATKHCASLPRIALLAIVALLAACATPPTPVAPPKSAPLTTQLPTQMVFAIRAVAGTGDGELAVQPLRDPEVEDLRATALRLESQQRYEDAAKTLDQALGIVPDDPALLQERAEAAVLMKDFAKAEALARRGLSLGSGVGPLCRRHWATIQQMRLVAGDAAGAADAKTQVAGCKVGGVDRY